MYKKIYYAIAFLVIVGTILTFIPGENIAAIIWVTITLIAWILPKSTVIISATVIKPENIQ